MTDENKNLEIKEEETKRFYLTKGFKKFLTVALGSFVGVFCALSLFALLHKPPMHPFAPCHCNDMRPAYHHFAGDKRGPKCHKEHKKADFNNHKKIKHRGFDKNQPEKKGE